MSWLDPTTMSLVTALVVVVCGILFLTDTVVHVASLAARLWALSFLAGILTVMSYLVWEFLADGWVAAAVGNAAFVTTTGSMWLGARAYNLRPLMRPALGVGVAAVATLVATLAGGPHGGAWAGAEVMFVALGVLAGLGAFESRCRPLGAMSPSWGLTAALALQCLYYIVRTGVFVTRGPQSPVFLEWFDTAPTSLITITLTIAVVVSISILRANERSRPQSREAAPLVHGADGFLDRDSFQRVLAGQMQRADQHRRHLAVVALRLHDLPQIRSAFGARAAEQVERQWRAGVQSAAPLAAFLGRCRPDTVLIAAPVDGETQAKRLAGRISQRVLDEAAGADGIISPVVGVGAAISGREPDAADLIEAAEEAARRSAESVDASVTMAQ